MFLFLQEMCFQQQKHVCALLSCLSRMAQTFPSTLKKDLITAAKHSQHVRWKCFARSGRDLCASWVCLWCVYQAYANRGIATFQKLVKYIEAVLWCNIRILNKNALFHWLNDILSTLCEGFLFKSYSWIWWSFKAKYTVQF